MPTPLRLPLVALLLAVLPAGCVPGARRPPTIANQPEAPIAAAGSVAVLRVKSAGSPPLRYDWRRNGVSLGAPSLPTYTTPRLRPEDDGAGFAVVVSNDAGATVSRTVRLRVLPATGPHPEPRPSDVTLPH